MRKLVLSIYETDIRKEYLRCQFFDEKGGLWLTFQENIHMILYACNCRNGCTLFGKLSFTRKILTSFFR